MNAKKFRELLQLAHQRGRVGGLIRRVSRHDDVGFRVHGHPPAGPRRPLDKQPGQGLMMPAPEVRERPVVGLLVRRKHPEAHVFIYGLLQALQRNLRTVQGCKRYKLRQCSVGPAIGHIKEAMGLRQFLLRGLSKDRFAWLFTSAAFNLLKLWRHGKQAMDRRGEAMATC